MVEHPIRNVTVYCSSSSRLHTSYLNVARDFGALLASSGRTLVYGGGGLGMMGACARSCREAGGHVVGIITERLRDAEQMDPNNHENIVVGTMRERKALLESRADAVVVLPGGVGTLEEFFEVFVGRLVGEHDKPVILVNTPDPTSGGGFYDPLQDMLEHVIASGFAKADIRDLLDICSTPDEVIDVLSNYEHAPESRNVGDRRRFMPGLQDDADAERIGPT
ncbi:MAG: TIGR00730 family Rossman fold protein [Planctomycetota bacterium]